MQLARLNADNHQLLGAESSLDEVRVHEALKDESPALLHELQRLEYKVNILLRLTAELALRSSGLPAAERVRMSLARLGVVRRASARRRRHRAAVGLHQLGIAAAAQDPERRRRRSAPSMARAPRSFVSSD